MTPATDPLVSIVLPCHNAEELLRPCLDALLSQTFEAWECVTVDDGSNDRTPAILSEATRQDTRFLYYGIPERRGLAAARNAVYDVATAPLVLFLSPNDRLHPEALSLLVGALRDNEQAGGAYGVSRFVDLQGRALRNGELEAYSRPTRGIVGKEVVDWPTNELVGFPCFAFRNPAAGGPVLLRRSVFEAAGGFDETLPGAETWDLWTRVSAMAGFARVDEHLSDHALPDPELPDVPDRMEHALRIRQKWAQIPTLTPKERAAAELCVLLSSFLR